MLDADGDVLAAFCPSFLGGMKGVVQRPNVVRLLLHFRLFVGWRNVKMKAIVHRSCVFALFAATCATYFVRELLLFEWRRSSLKKA
jgi:hypothetical protein